MRNALAALISRAGYSLATMNSLSLPDLAVDFDSQLITAVSFAIAVALDYLSQKIKKGS